LGHRKSKISSCLNKKEVKIAKEKVSKNECCCYGKNKVGLTVGLFCALLHAIWAILVGIGVGKSVIDSILPLHFISTTYNVITFSFVNALSLVILAFIGGYIIGWLFMLLWNWICKK